MNTVRGGILLWRHILIISRIPLIRSRALIQAHIEGINFAIHLCATERKKPTFYLKTKTIARAIVSWQRLGGWLVPCLMTPELRRTRRREDGLNPFICSRPSIHSSMCFSSRAQRYSYRSPEVRPHDDLIPPFIGCDPQSALTSDNWACSTWEYC